LTTLYLLSNFIGFEEQIDQWVSSCIVQE